ncbi:photosystem I assembly protein Ycf3 [bacterium BMS3Abin03]|nr:photosystem I assembly protein Ycf3 [bacterium BMS3Abin03]
MNIKQWLEEKGFGQYAELFEGNEITLEELPEIATHNDLKEIGIKSFIHRKQILAEIAVLSGKTPGGAEQQNVPSSQEVSAKDGHKAPSSSDKEPAEKIQQDDASSHLKLDEQEQQIINSYPYLIAFPFSEMLNRENPFLKIQLLKDVFLNTLKYLGLLTATEYLLSTSKSKQVNQLFREKLFRPQFGHWNHFIRETLAFLQEVEHEFKIPELVEAYNTIELGKGKKTKKYNLEMYYTDDFGDIQVVKQQVTAIGGLINFRNRYIGHSVTLSDDKSKEVFELYYPIMLDLLGKLDFCIRYPMLKYNDGRTWKLMGTTVSQMETNIQPEHNTSKLWLQLTDGKQIPLIPFFILPKQYLSGVLDKVEMFVYEQFTGKRIVYFSPEQEIGETSGDVVQMLNTLLKVKEQEPIKKLQDVTEEELKRILKEQTGITKAQLIGEKKVIEGIYQPRAEAENNIHQFLFSGKQMYFLAAGAGSGKTNLLNEVCKNLENKEYDILFLRAGRFQTNTLKDELIRILNVEKDSDFSKSSLFNRTTDNPLFILLDGGNEHQKPESFFKSCLDFLQEIEGNGVKLIVSWRIYNNKELPPLSKDQEYILFHAQENESAPQKDESLLVKYAGSLNSLDKKELEGAWEFFTSHKSKKFKPQFSLSDLEYKDSQFTEQLTNPLHLRIFLELYNNKGLKKTGKLLRIWPAWYEQLEISTPGAKEFIQKLCAIMYAREQTILDLDSLFDDPGIGKQIRDLNIDSTYQKLLKRGVLTQYFKNDLLVLTFTIEAAWHYILSLFLNELPEVSTGNGLVEVIQTKKDLKGLEEAASLMLRDDVINEKYDRIQEIIDNEDAYNFVEICAPALAYAVEYQNVKKVLAVTENYIPVNLIPVLFDTKIILNGKNKDELLYGMLLAVSKSEQFEDINAYWKMQTYSMLGDVSVDYQEKIRYQEKTIQLIKEGLNDKESGFSPDKFLIEIISLALFYQGQSYDYGKKGGYEASISLLIDNESIILQENPQNNIICIYYDTLGSIYDDAGDAENAEKYFLKAIQFDERVTGLYDKNSMPYKELGEIYLSNKQFEKAEKYFDQELKISESQYGLNHQNTVDIHEQLRKLYYLSGDLEKAKSYFQKEEDYYKGVIQLYESHLGDTNPDLTEPLSSLGKLYLDDNRFEDAEQCFLKGLNICISNFGDESVETADFYSQISTLYSDKEEYEKALDFEQKALNIRLKHLGSKHIQTVLSYQNVSICYSGLSDYKNAIKYSEFALKSNLAIYGEEHEDVADCYYFLGQDYYNDAQYEQSIINYNNALEIRIKLFGEEFEGVADCYYKLGMDYLKENQYEKAIVNYQKALEIRIKLFGEEYENVADCYNKIGLSFYGNNQFEQAIFNHQKAIKILINLYGEKHYDVAYCYYDLGRDYYSINQYEQSIENFQKALKILINLYGKEHEDVANCYYNLGAIYNKVDQYEQSIENCNTALEIRLKLFGEENEDVANCYYKMGMAHYFVDQNEQAIANHKKALEIRIKLFGEEHEDVADCYMELGDIYFQTDEELLCAENYRNAFNIRKNLFGLDSEETDQSRFELGKAYYYADMKDEAKECFSASLNFRKKFYGKKSEEYKAVKEYM